MADEADRREARRFNMALPMRVVPLEAHHEELLVQTRDVSYRGLYFRSEANFEVGGEIDFVITLPQMVVQPGAVDIRCHGQVVRVEAGSYGLLGVAAKIDRYEFLPVAAS